MPVRPTPVCPGQHRDTSWLPCWPGQLLPWGRTVPCCTNMVTHIEMGCPQNFSCPPFELLVECNQRLLGGLLSGGPETFPLAGRVTEARHPASRLSRVGHLAQLLGLQLAHVPAAALPLGASQVLDRSAGCCCPCTRQASAPPGARELQNPTPGVARTLSSIVSTQGL